MKVRPRITDILLVAGVAILLVWTPAYFAQRTEKRSLLDGEQFWLPDFRDGDRMELELIVTWPNGTSYSSGRIIDVEFLKPGPDSRPGTILVERQTFHRTHVDLGGAVLALEERAQAKEFDSRLGAVWLDADGLRSNKTPMSAHGPFDWTWNLGSDAEVHHEGAPGLTPWLWVNRSRALQYDRASALESLVQYFDPPPPPPEPDPDAPPQPMMASAAEFDPDAPYRIHGVYEHRSRQLHAAGLEEYTQIFPSNRTREWVFLGWEFDLAVALETGVPTEGGSRSWTWYARDFPSMVGQHGEFRSIDGRLHVAVDLVPLRLQRGSDAIRPDPNEWAPPDSAAGIPIRNWTQDNGPLLSGWTASRLVDALREPSIPPEVRNFAWAGAWLGGVAWLGNLTSEGDPTGEAEWIVVLVHDDGESLVASFGTAADGDSLRDGSVRVLCGQEITVGPRTIRATCSPVDVAQQERWFSDIGPDTPTSPPSLMARQMTKEFTRMAADSGEDRMPALMWIVPGLTHRYEIPPERGHGYSYETPLSLRGADGLWREFGRIDTRKAALIVDTPRFYWGIGAAFADGGIETAQSADRAVVASRLASGQPRPLAASVDPLQRTDFVDHKAAYGGLLLVTLGLLARLFAGLNSGAHLPLFAFLYAKIAKDRSLDHDRRQALFAAVEQDEGIGFNALARRLGLRRAVSFHHLDTLRRNGLVKEVRLGRARHYALPHRSEREALRLACLKHDGWKTIVQAVELEPGVSLTDLTERVGRDKSRVSRISARLERLGVLRRERTDAGLRLFPAVEMPAAVRHEERQVVTEPA